MSINNGNKDFERVYSSLSRGNIEKTGYDFLDGFYYYLLVGNSTTTAWNYMYKVIKFLKDENITDPSKIRLNNYVRHIASLNGTSSNKTTSYAALKKFSAYLVANDYLEKDYMEFVSRPKRIETQEQIEKRAKAYLTKDECKAALEAVDKSFDPNWKKARDKAILSVFLGTGIRRAALFKLDMSDINLEEKYILVSEKGNKFRKIICPDYTINNIKEWLEYRDMLNINNETAVFISMKYNRISADAIARIVKKYTGKTPHKLRATYGTEIYNKTHDLYLTQNMMGHSSPTTTEIYIRDKENENAKKAANIMEDFMK